MTDIIPPVLSTEQEELFQFDKFQSNIKNRSYFGPEFDNDGHSEVELKDKIKQFYSIEKLVNFLKLKTHAGVPKYRAITLQFPDNLISDSAIIVQLLQDELKSSTVHGHQADEIDINAKYDHDNCNDNDIEAVHEKCSSKKNGACTCDHKKSTSSEASKNVDQKIWILADTSYSPCCVDEVAAEHVDADIVIHFGDACLNPIQKLPAVYVFGKPYLDLESTVSSFKSTYLENDCKICLMSDAPYSTHLLALYQALKPQYSNLVYADIYNVNNSVLIDHIDLNDDAVRFRAVNRSFHGEFKDADIDEEDDDSLTVLTQEYELFHITTPPSPRLLELSTKFSTITTFDPASNTASQGPYPSLTKRYRFMHVARTAGTIGILVNTLSLSNTKILMNRVIEWIKAASKKHYVFVVGKPNVAKLANFESIDVWCVLGCGQSGIIIDNVGDYYKPIVTPYELQLALSDELSWTGKWIVDFKEVLSLETDDAEAEGDLKDDDDDDDDDDDAPEFDAVTGTYVSTARPLRRYVQHLEIGESRDETDETALVKKFSSAVTIKGTVSTSAVALQNRHWTGLGSDFTTGEDGEGDEGALVEEGRGGVARGYDFDRANNNI